MMERGPFGADGYARYGQELAPAKRALRGGADARPASPVGGRRDEAAAGTVLAQWCGMSSVQAPSTAPEALSTWPPDPPLGGLADEASGRRWTWKIGRILGIDVFVHATFVLLLGWVALSHAAAGWGAVWRGLALIVAVFAIVVMHELGHALVARRFGVSTRDITLLPIGGIARLDRMPEKPIEELLIAVAGPAVNVTLALALWALLAVMGSSTSLAGLDVVGGSFLTKLMWLNVSLAVFNLVPAFPMDGGRVARATLALNMDYARATQIAARLGQGLALLFAVVGFLYNPMLVLIALFVWMGAKQEAASVTLKRSLSGVPVGSAMITAFRTLEPSDRLSSAAELITAGFQHDFPVFDGSKLVGVLTRGDVIRGLSSDGGVATVGNAMHRHFEVAHPADMLEGVLNRLQTAQGAPIVVVRNDAVVGLITAESLGEFIVVQGARRAGVRPSV